MLHVFLAGTNEAGECEWKCPSCVKPESQKDHVYEYAIIVTWMGILDLVHRAMIRNGDGPAMMAMWRINMLRMWRGNHYKYLILGHRLLAGMCPTFSESQNKRI